MLRAPNIRLFLVLQMIRVPNIRLFLVLQILCTSNIRLSLVWQMLCTPNIRLSPVWQMLFTPNIRLTPVWHVMRFEYSSLPCIADVMHSEYSSHLCLAYTRTMYTPGFLILFVLNWHLITILTFEFLILFTNQTHANSCNTPLRAPCVTTYRVCELSVQCEVCCLLIHLTPYFDTRRQLVRTVVPCSICLTFRHRASCILRQTFHYSPENAFYIFNQQIYFIIWYLLDHASSI